MMMEGVEKQAGRLWDKFSLKEKIKEKSNIFYVSIGIGRYAFYGSWKATSILMRENTI